MVLFCFVRKDGKEDEKDEKERKEPDKDLDTLIHDIHQRLRITLLIGVGPGCRQRLDDSKCPGTESKE